VNNAIPIESGLKFHRTKKSNERESEQRHSSFFRLNQAMNLLIDELAAHQADD
jgi:hypothetical protein